MRIRMIRNLFDRGFGIRDGKTRIRDKLPGSATLLSVKYLTDTSTLASKRRRGSDCGQVQLDKTLKAPPYKHTELQRRQVSDWAGTTRSSAYAPPYVHAPGIAKATRFWLWTGTTSCWRMWRKRAWGWGSPSSHSAPVSPPTGSSGTALSARIYDVLIVFWLLFRIHEILAWIRIRGSMSLTILDPHSDSDPAIFVIDLQDANKKLI